jgi:hypothetical protein
MTGVGPQACRQIAISARAQKARTRSSQSFRPSCGFPATHLRYPCSMSRYDRPSHRVYMGFFLRGAWHISFLEADCKTVLPLHLTFRDPEKIRELARRDEARGLLMIAR